LATSVGDAATGSVTIGWVAGAERAGGADVTGGPAVGAGADVFEGPADGAVAAGGGVGGGLAAGAVALAAGTVVVGTVVVGTVVVGGATGARCAAGRGAVLAVAPSLLTAVVPARWVVRALPGDGLVTAGSVLAGAAGSALAEEVTALGVHAGAAPRAPVLLPAREAVVPCGEAGRAAPAVVSPAAPESGASVVRKTSMAGPESLRDPV
jgi:hypothetical protein